MKTVKVYFYSLPVGGVFISKGLQYAKTGLGYCRGYQTGQGLSCPPTAIVEVPDWYAKQITGIEQAPDSAEVEKVEAPQADPVDPPAKKREYVLERNPKRIPGWDD